MIEGLEKAAHAPRWPPRPGPWLPRGPGLLVFRRSAAARSAVRLPRRRALLLPAVPARPARVARGPDPALGNGRERRDAAPGQPGGRSPLSWQGHLCGSFSYAWAARLYVLAHVFLSFAGMWALLRNWQITSAGAAIGSLAYAFGAPVLFQYCNVIYLVGAAWVPWGLRAADRLVRLGSPPRLCLS